jgi:hypothetical protein
LHSTFAIPCTNNEREEFLPLKNDRLKELQLEFQEVNYLIIDEFSMLSQVMFGKIDQRLRQAKNNNCTMGGISIILIGDPGQLLPVCGSSLYNSKLSNGLAMNGFLSYQKFQIVVTLESLMRQENSSNDLDQKHFIELLPRLRNGTSTIDDWKLLKTRVLTDDNKSQFQHAIHIFNENEQVDKHNLEKLQELAIPICELKAINSTKKGNLFNNLACVNLFPSPISYIFLKRPSNNCPAVWWSRQFNLFV